jgi:hypothetical protein
VTSPLYPVQAAALASAGRTLAAEFPAWQSGPVADGVMWGAYWQTPDGRHRRYIVAPSAVQLLGALRERAAGPPSGEITAPVAATP